MENIKKLNSIKELFDDQFQELKIKFHEAYQKLKEKLEIKYEAIDTQIEFVKSEIEIRIECLKCELDKLNDYLKTELDNCKQELIGNFKADESVPNNNDYYFKLEEINERIQNLEKFNLPVTFLPSESSIQMDLVGNLNFSYRQEQLNCDLIDRLKLFKYKITDINHSVSSLCVLPNGYLLAANCVSQNLIVYDADFNLIKTFFQFNNRLIFPLSITTNNKDRIYISDSNSHRIIMTDIDLNLLYEIGSFGSEVDQFNYPCGIVCYENLVYICDSQNKRLQVYNKNLVFQKSNAINFSPFEIKCINNFVCLRDNDNKFIYFFDLNNFELKIKHEGHNGTIFELNNIIYEYFNDTNIIYVYNKDCQIIESIKINLPINEIKFNGFESICYFNGKFILATENCKKICLI